jgi:hypothetical protein
VTLRGLARGAGWTFGNETPKATVAPGTTVEMSLPARCLEVDADRLIPPDVEVCYDYVDSRDRHVPIVLRRRVPLRRRVEVAAARWPIILDGRTEEIDWALARPLGTAVWGASAYETGQPEPTARVLAAADGLYLHVDARDAQVSAFRGERVLSDALFVGAVADWSRDDDAPVVVVFPFGGDPPAVRAPWHHRRIDGAEAAGVRSVAVKAEDVSGWTCEAFVPWQVLLGEDTAQGALRFNVGVWDNDGDLFTELHSWAPTADPSLWGILELAPPQE